MNEQPEHRWENLIIGMCVLDEWKYYDVQSSDSHDVYQDGGNTYMIEKYECRVKCKMRGLYASDHWTVVSVVQVL